MLSRFYIIPERQGQTDRQTDGRTDRIAISISRVSDKNWKVKWQDRFSRLVRVSCLAAAYDVRASTCKMTDDSRRRRNSNLEQLASNARFHANVDIVACNDTADLCLLQCCAVPGRIASSRNVSLPVYRGISWRYETEIIIARWLMVCLLQKMQLPVQDGQNKFFLQIISPSPIIFTARCYA